MNHLIVAAALLPLPALAEAPAIEDANTIASGGTWRVEVTLSHPDTGWDHYADGWRIEDADGTVLGTRVLAHPHVSEQPFTRSLGGVSVPDGITTVFIRSRCNIDGWSTTTTPLPLSH